jgi:hypothetical protein
MLSRTLGISIFPVIKTQESINGLEFLLFLESKVRFFIGCGSPAVHFSPDFQSGAAISIRFKWQGLSF